VHFRYALLKLLREGREPVGGIFERLESGVRESYVERPVWLDDLAARPSVPLGRSHLRNDAREPGFGRSGVVYVQKEIAGVIEVAVASDDDALNVRRLFKQISHHTFSLKLSSIMRCASVGFRERPVKRAAI
jgi:hypothetical protein